MKPRTILKEYLEMRRKLGFKLQKHEETLRGFLNFFEKQNRTYLTTDLALKWARKPKDADPAWWSDRLGMLRGFALYWQRKDPRVVVPPMHIIMSYYKRPIPYIYSLQQTNQILADTRKLPTQDNFIYWTLYGLLLATGMRIGEALALNNNNVNLFTGEISIFDSKLNKSRIVPLHKTTLDVLKQYVTKRNRLYSQDRSDAFFTIIDGRRMSHYMAWNVFKRIIITYNIKTSKQKLPRIHDLRHTFVIRTLTEFYKSGEDINSKIHALSTYLGHKDIRCTYWYLTSVPQLMAQVLSRLETKIGGNL